jgi:hypothetical protein
MLRSAAAQWSAKAADRPFRSDMPISGGSQRGARGDEALFIAERTIAALMRRLGGEPALHKADTEMLFRTSRWPDPAKIEVRNWH